MNTGHTKEVAVFSNDHNLMRSIEGGAFSSVSEHRFKYQVNSSIRDIENLSGANVVVYDLDLVDNDQARIIEDINHFVLNTDSKPLIVIGDKKAINETLELEAIKPYIARTITKPISYSAVHLLVNTVLPKQETPTSLVSESQGDKFKLIAASAIIGLSSVLALALFFIGGDEQPSVQKTTNIAKVATPSTIDSEALEQAVVDQEIALSIDGLLERASIAIDEGRITSPSNANALYYYDQVLEMDSYDRKAYEGRKEILKTLRSSLPALLSADNLDDARHIVDTLISAEPFRDDNKQLLSAFDEALAANKRSQNDATPSTSDKLTVVPTEIKPTKTTSTKKASGFTFSKEIAKPTPKKVVAPVTANISEPVAEPQPIAEPIVAPSPANTLQETKQPSVAANPSVNDTKPVRQQVASIALPSIEAPVLIKRVNAKYPRFALVREVVGWVEIAFQVNEQGEVINETITKANPETVFDQASLKAIKKWKFEPAKNTKTGKAVISSVKKTRINFNINFNS